MKRLKKFSAAKEVRAIARERVGTVKPSHAIKPKAERKPKYPAKGIDDEP